MRTLISIGAMLGGLLTPTSEDYKKTQSVEEVLNKASKREKMVLKNREKLKLEKGFNKFETTDGRYILAVTRKAALKKAEKAGVYLIDKPKRKYWG